MEPGKLFVPVQVLRDGTGFVVMGDARERSSRRQPEQAGGPSGQGSSDARDRDVGRKDGKKGLRAPLF